MAVLLKLASVMFSILLFLPVLGLHGQHFLGTVLKVEKDTLIDLIDFDNSTDNWKMSNVKEMDTRDDDQNINDVSRYYMAGSEEKEVGVVVVPEISMTGVQGGSLSTSLRLAGEGEARLLITFLLYLTGRHQIRDSNSLRFMVDYNDSLLITFTRKSNLVSILS